MKLYRVVTDNYTGPGSFWSPDPDVAKKYGKPGGRLVEIEARGRALELNSDEELVQALQRMRVRDAEERVLDADWLTEDVFNAFRRHDVDWVVRTVDPSISTHAVEWIYVGKGTLT